MADGQTLTVHLLGGFRIATGHEKVTGLDQARLQRLLVYLLLHRRAPRSRQQIAFTLDAAGGGAVMQSASCLRQRGSSE